MSGTFTRDCSLLASQSWYTDPERYNTLLNCCCRSLTGVLTLARDSLWLHTSRKSSHQKGRRWESWATELWWWAAAQLGHKQTNKHENISGTTQASKPTHAQVTLTEQDPAGGSGYQPFRTNQCLLVTPALRNVYLSWSISLFWHPGREPLHYFMFLYAEFHPKLHFSIQYWQ